MLTELEDNEGYRWGAVYVISKVSEIIPGLECLVVIDTDDDTEYLFRMVELFRLYKPKTVGFTIE